MRAARSTLAIGIASLAACGAVSGEPRRTPVETTAPSPPASAPEVPTRDDCWREPLHIDVGVPRNLDTRDGVDLPPARYKKMRWAVGHTKPPAAAFALSAGQAVDAVVELEAKQPGLIPAPYRDALLASPRDAALRLRIGACEAKDSGIRRRAAYDGAMALLLGGSPAEASQLILLGTRGKSTTVTSCERGQNTCPDGSRCNTVRGECVTLADEAYVHISTLEAAVETALTRAMIGELTTPKRLTPAARGGWMDKMVHWCGTQLCKLTDYEVNNRTSVVVWDLRDRGTVEVQNSPSSDDF
jgi:hypothetical protein